LINKKLIEDVEADSPLPGPPNTIKRPFWKDLWSDLFIRLINTDNILKLIKRGWLNAC
jgi:hypothetical protein